MNRHVPGMLLVLVLAAAGIASAHESADASKQAKRLEDATAVYHELITAADRSVPQQLLDNCKCIAVLPNVLSAGIGIGGRHGSGVMVCRREGGGWSAPAFVNITGGSWGLQLGAESTDLVLFFMTDRGARSLVHGTKVTLGGKASVAAGPFGRSGEASTNLELKAEIYSYARSKGLFAGLSIEGARLAPNANDVRKYYGAGATYDSLLFGSGPASMPAEAETFRHALP